MSTSTTSPTSLPLGLSGEPLQHCLQHVKLPYDCLTWSKTIDRQSLT